MFKKAIIASAVAFAVSGCATIFSPSSDNISFDSTPSGAKVFINGGNVGTTPLNTPVKRSLTPPQVTIKKDGYETTNINLQNEFNITSALNLTNIFAYVIDAATGKIMNYSRLNYEVDLEKK